MLPITGTREFEHYSGCRFRDVDNCGACALTNQKQKSPNYAAWPLAYMANHRTIPAKWRAAFNAELHRTDNLPYAENIRRHINECGVTFSDGRGIGG